MKVIVAGGRKFDDYFMVELAMERLIAVDDTIISGGAAGSDALGERYALRNGHPLHIERADWHKHGRSAGPIRNRKMAEMADALVAFWDGKSIGTKNMIQTALRSGLEVHVYRY